MSARGQALSPWMWLLLPAVAALVASLVLAAPVRVFGFGLPEPVLPVILAFAWPVIRPSVMGPILLLGLGLFLDFLWYTPLGLWPMCLVAVYFGVLMARSLILGQSTGVLAIWWGAAVVLAFFLAYLISALDSHVAPSLLAVGLDFAFTLAFFPLTRRLIERFEDADIRFR